MRRVAAPWPGPSCSHALSAFIALADIEVTQADWKTLRASEERVEVYAEHGGVAFSAAVDLKIRPTRNDLVYSGTRGTAWVDFFHGYSASVAGPATRLSKATQPLRVAASTTLAATPNLGGRLLRREWAYPGLPELIERFHAAARGAAPPPISPAETLAIYRLIDRLRDSA